MTGSAFSGVPLGRSGADRFIREKRDDIEKIGGGFGGGMAKGWSGGRSIGGFLERFFSFFFPLPFLASFLAVFGTLRTYKIAFLLQFYSVFQGSTEFGVGGVFC